jgi:translocation and assembly module TamA
MPRNKQVSALVRIYEDINGERRADGVRRGAAARRTTCPTLSAALLCAVSLGSISLATSPAHAFDLFGWSPFSSGKESDETSQVPDPFPYTVTLQTSGSDELRSALESASALVSDQSTPPSGEAGLIARANNDLERLVGRLYMSGYYAGTVDIRIAGVSLEAALRMPSLPGPRPVPVSISVDPGPRFTFADVAVESTTSVPPGTLGSPSSYGLVSGETANSEKVLRAEARILAQLKADSYAFAAIERREIVADHKTNTLDVRLVASAGPATVFGPVSVSGADVTDPDFIISQARLPVGEPYNPERIEEARKRLNELGIFSSVLIVEGEAAGPDGSLPMTIEVAERKRNVIGAGANWSSSEGFGLEAYWRRRNLFGRGELLTVEGSVGRLGDNSLDNLEYAARIAFEKPGAFGPRTTFTTSLSARQEIPDAYRSRNITADAFVRHEFSDVLSARVGGEVQFADEVDVFGSRSYLLTGVIGEVTYDTRDDKLNPTEGINSLLSAEPAYDAKGNTFLFFTKGEISAYQAIDDARRFVLAGRLGAGSIIAPSVRSVPAARRFFSGGGGSIRGYAYRNVGPRLNGEVTGGRSYVQASAELRMKVTEEIGLVGFVDAGNSFDAIYPDFSEGMKVGVGAGVRYFTPVGPLRLDVAVPLSPEKDDPKFAVYVGLSQAF